MVKMQKSWENIGKQETNWDNIGNKNENIAEKDELEYIEETEWFEEYEISRKKSKKLGNFITNCKNSKTFL